MSAIIFTFFLQSLDFSFQKMRTAIIWSIFGFFLLSQAFWIFSLGTLGLPSLFHPSDTFMDLYNTAFFSQHTSDPYLDWKSIYSPLSFLLLNHVSFIDCTVQYILGEATVRVDYSILNQYCQAVSSSVELRTSSIVINTAFLLVHIITIYQLFKALFRIWLYQRYQSYIGFLHRYFSYFCVVIC